ncbi:MAG TPA: hypothetical protein VLT45_15735 [Kofleriaceae bacterium]|nr:hypothetical protein [Kofleriaceae bacterium]
MRAAWFTLLLPACVIGAPPGFSPGESWTFPLVDPLAHEPLTVPVVIGGKGPLLFVLDPDAETSIDVGFIPQLAIVGNGPSYAPLTDVQIGTLHVASLPFIATKAHTFDTAGRRIAGVIGREVITSALVLGFDRDRGTAWLATPRHASLPEGARHFAYFERTTGEDAPKDRGPYATGTIDGREQDFHIDLGHVENTLRGGPRTAKQVSVGGIDRYGVAFAPFTGDFLAEVRSATLGLDFFWQFAVALDFDSHRIYVAPRRQVDRATRIARWPLACKHPGCAELVLHGKDLEVIPERTPVQLVVRAAAHDGSELPTLEVDLDAGARHFAVALDDRYSDAVLDVIDASPFPRTCIDAKGCVLTYQP